MAALLVVLASASPRRRELLANLGVQFQCTAADIDETPQVTESPADYVARIAREKCLSVACSLTSPCVVLGADTSVVLGDQILGKPQDTEHAHAMLRSLSNKQHRVLTGLYVHSPQGGVCDLVETEVEFIALTDATISAYLATDESWDKAGGYGIQGVGGAFVKRIAGSYSNVVGLPLSETWALLSRSGVVCSLDGVAV